MNPSHANIEKNRDGNTAPVVYDWNIPEEEVRRILNIIDLIYFGVDPWLPET